MLCAKIGWNWPSGSGEDEENVKFTMTTTTTDKLWKKVQKAFTNQSEMVSSGNNLQQFPPSSVQNLGQ